MLQPVTQHPGHVLLQPLVRLLRPPEVVAAAGLPEAKGLDQLFQLPG